MVACEGFVQKPDGKAPGNLSTSSHAEMLPKGKFKDRPSDLDSQVKNSYNWIDSKRIDDNVGPYWRIHDKLYDLTDFMNKHPGGKYWIEVTKGTDITEAFESAHISLTPETLLTKYFAKNATTPRNSPYTFHEDGFYKTLKRKARPILQKIGKGPTLKMLMIQDTLMLTFLLLAIIGSISHSHILIILSGITLAMTMMCAHNFFHQRDNFRMYYFDLSFLSSRAWRISHALSHHLYSNTRYDMELTGFEPYFVYSPKPEKNLLQRYGAPCYEILLLPFLLFIEALKLIPAVLLKKMTLKPENLLPLAELMLMCSLSTSIGLGFRLWMLLHCAASTWFWAFALTVAHHHPGIYHEGDRFRDQPDWGLCQLDAVRDRIEIRGDLFFVATTFGDHSLHHLFPTVDHSKLNDLYPVFFETCKEFNVPFEFWNQWELVKGMYLQLANDKPNTLPPGYREKEE